MRRSKMSRSREPGFSLYSTTTDSEDQVTSAHRGLDRCAALLRNLLSPEKDTQAHKHLEARKRSHFPTKRQHAIVSKKTKKGSSEKQQPSGAKFPGAAKYHVHPGASSTPSVKHCRSRTEPKQQGEVQVSSGLTARGKLEAKPGDGHETTKSTRKCLAARRRLKTEPGIPNRIFGNEAGRHANIVTSKPGNCSSRRCIFKPEAKSSPSTNKAPVSDSTASTTLHTHTAPHTSVLPSQGWLHPGDLAHLSQFHYPYPPYPYYPQPWSYFSCQPPMAMQSVAPLYPTATVSSYTGQQSTTAWVPSPPHAQAPCHPQPKMQNLPPIKQVSPSLHSRSDPIIHSELYTSAKPGNMQCSSQPPFTSITQGSLAHCRLQARPIATQNDTAASTLPTGDRITHAQTQESTQNGGVMSPPQGQTLQLIQSLAREMIKSLEMDITKMTESRGEDFIKQLESIARSQHHYHKQLMGLCRHLPDYSTSTTGAVDTPPSTADWLAQLHQVELEKSHLLQRVLQGETAYSETKGLLDQAKKELDNVRSKWECEKSQAFTWKNELESKHDAFETLVARNRATEEELKNMRAVNMKATQQLNIKVIALQQQIDTLEQQLSKTKEESYRGEDCLATTKCALGTTQEELQMVKLALMEKETELLQAQDQLLGLRQCLAYFLAELTKLDQSGSSQQLAEYYCVPEKAVQQFQSLVNDGNVNSFLAVYAKGTPNNSFDSPDRSLETPSTLATQSPPSSPVRGTYDLQLHTGHKTAQSPLELLHDTVAGQDKRSPNLSTVTSPLDNSSVISSEGSQVHSKKQQHQTAGRSPAMSDVSVRSSVTGVDLQSMLTTSSEVDFQRDLASLDADIERLQIQFQIAVQQHA